MIIACLTRPITIFTVILIIRHRLVDVVQASEEHSPCAIGEMQAKAFQFVAPVAAVGRTWRTSRLDVCRAATVIFTLQDNIHSVFLLALVLDAEVLVLFRLLVIDLDVLHGEVRQILQHHLVLALEEILAVERQVVYLPSVDEYLTVLLQLHARQLLDEAVQHRAFWHVESVGIIDQRITLPYHLNPSGFYRQLA